MKKSFLRCRYATLSLLAMASSSASAASLILASEGGWNGFGLEASIRSGFREAGGVPGVAKEVSKTDSGFFSISPDVHAPGTTLTMVSTLSGTSPLSATIFPDTGSAKDISTGTVDVSFTIGTVSTDDAMAFSFNSTTSAETAMVDFGSGPQAVDSFFEVTIRLTTYAPAHIPGAVIQLPDLPSLTAPAPSVETMLATVNSFLGGAPLSGYQLPGDPGLSVPLQLSGVESFEYVFNYSIVTPFGSDPTVGYSLIGSSSVPEPSILPLLGIGLLFRRRRK